MTRPVVEGGPAVVCLGETMAQIVPIDGLRLHEASACAFGVAGAESNVAISLSRLGTAAFWAGFVGDDPMGLRVLGELRRHGVVTKLARTMPGRRTGVYFKDPAPEGSDIYYYRSGSAATLMDGEYAERIAAVRPRWIHLTGVTPALSENCREAVISLIELAVIRERVSVSTSTTARPSGQPATLRHSRSWPSPIVAMWFSSASTRRRPCGNLAPRERSGTISRVRTSS